MAVTSIFLLYLTLNLKSNSGLNHQFNSIPNHINNDLKHPLALQNEQNTPGFLETLSTKLQDYLGFSDTQWQEPYDKYDLEPRVASNTSSKLIPLTEFKNFVDGKEVFSTYVEVQNGPEVANKSEKSLLHFVAEDDEVIVKQHKAITGVLTLHKKLDGIFHGKKCPAESINVYVVDNSSVGDLNPVVTFGPIKVPVRDGNLEVDLTTYFEERGRETEHYNFWILLDTEHDCYYGFDAADEHKPTLRIDVTALAVATTKSTTTLAGYIAPGVCITVVALLLFIYKLRSGKTDYTYFYDNRANDVIACA